MKLLYASFDYRDRQTFFNENEMVASGKVLLN
jgi:hypothetical protein